MDNCSVCRRKSFLVKLCKCHIHYCINHKDNHVCTFDVVVNGRAVRNNHSFEHVKDKHHFEE